MSVNTYHYTNVKIENITINLTNNEKSQPKNETQNQENNETNSNTSFEAKIEKFRQNQLQQKLLDQTEENIGKEDSNSTNERMINFDFQSNNTNNQPREHTYQPEENVFEELIEPFIPNSEVEKTRYFQKDTRLDIHQLETKCGIEFSNKVKEVAKSVGCFIHKEFLKGEVDQEGKRVYKFRNVLKRHERVFRTRPFIELGKNEPFYNELSPGCATGSLIGKKRVLTAGHVICDQPYGDILNGMDEIRKLRFVFGFASTEPNVYQTTFPRDNVYKIERIIGYNKDGRNDWAILELDREVIGRNPLPICFKPLKEKEPIFAIGYPYGVSQKVTINGTFERKEDYGGICRIETCKGNSGSPIFSRKCENGLDEIHAILDSGGSDIRVQKNYEGIPGNYRIVENFEYRPAEYIMFIKPHFFKICIEGWKPQEIREYNYWTSRRVLRLELDEKIENHNKFVIAAGITNVLLFPLTIFFGVEARKRHKEFERCEKKYYKLIKDKW